MKKSFEKFNLSTDIFVYPYTYYNFPCAKTILKNHGFNYIFGYKKHMRMSIENIAVKNYTCDY